MRTHAHAGPAHDERHVDVGLVRRLLARGHAVLTEVEPVVWTRTRCRCRRAAPSPATCARGGRRRGRGPGASGSACGRARRWRASRRVELREVAHVGRRSAHVGLVEARRPRRGRVREPPPVRGRRRRGLVGCVHRQEGEERSVRAGGAADEVVGEAHVHVGAVVARPVAMHAVRLVLVQHVAVLRVRVAVDRARPVVPSRRHVVGRGAVGIAVEVLAGERGRVPGPVQAGGDGVLLHAGGVGALEAAVVTAVGPHPGVVGVLPAQRRGARRAAQRVAHQVLVEGGPRGSRSAPARAGAHLGEVEVVGEDEEDVGAPPAAREARGHRGAARHRDGGGQRRQHDAR